MNAARRVEGSYSSVVNTATQCVVCHFISETNGKVRLAAPSVAVRFGIEVRCGCVAHASEVGGEESSTPQSASGLGLGVGSKSHND